MAARRALWPDRAARLSALEATVTRPPRDDEPTLGDLAAALDVEAQEILGG